MFSITNCAFMCFVLVLLTQRTLSSDAPHLLLYSQGDLEFTDVIVKRVNDNITLVCELRGENAKHRYIWNYVALDLGNDTNTEKTPFTIDPLSPSNRSTFFKDGLQITDSGHYMCSAPPFSVTKFILVQPKNLHCAKGAFTCDRRCVLATNVCDGRSDCMYAEDEDPLMCGENVCMRSDRLNCSDNRCIPSSACCRVADVECKQPHCCNEHPSYSKLEGPSSDFDLPILYDDRHAPDDYGFIQSTIYTVTACALIFMIAVVLLISAICKMHMKRAALRSYAHAERATRRHYSVHYAQAQRFPPCYEASRLLEDGRASSAPQSPHDSPNRQNLQCNSACPSVEVESRPGFGLASLSAIFSSRYRQVPMPSEVEMSSIRASTSSSIQNYRSPTFCELQDDLFPTVDSQSARELNYITPIDYRRNDRQRLTLQLGRFHLTLPFRERRPDTPNVESDNDTYTLNGRTIRLLGADLENYPVMPDGSIRPPSYAEAVRYKLFGPPPEYLSREALNSRVDLEARSNVEMPPNYDELGGRIDGNGNPPLSSVIDDLPAIDNDNDLDSVNNNG